MLIITQPEYSAPGALCEIIGQTEKRFQVRQISTGCGNMKGSHVEGGHAQGGIPYVHKDRVLILNATQEQYDAYVAAHNQRKAAIDQATKDAWTTFNTTLEAIRNM